jgi:hypothetical protein
MGALSSPGRVTKEYAPLTVIRSYPMDATAQIWEGGIVALDNTGYAVPGSTSTTLLAVGVAQESKLAGSVDGDTQILVHTGVFFLNVDTAFSQTNVGSLCYIVDDQTVSMTATSRSIAGTVAAVDTGGAWVAIGLEAAIDNTTLTAQIASYASTSTPGGASLIGVFDTATLYSAADVEAALAEVMKKANAGLAAPAVFSVYMSSLASATPFTFLPGVAGKIAAVDAFMRKVSTTSASVTLQAYISAQAVTGGVLTLNSTACSTLGARITGSAVSSANSFTATQLITLKPTVTTAFTEGEMEILVFFASA